MIIYKVTNLITNKVYIGKTIYKLKKRKRQHLCAAKSNSGNMLFHKAIRKYGEENFCWEVLDTVMFSDLLLDLEKFYIIKYNCKQPNGYNLTDGGGGVVGFTVSDETRKKMSEARMGHKMSDETKRKLSKANMGKRLSEETKKKMSRPMSEDQKKKISKAHRGLHVGEKNINYGKHLSKEHKRKISNGLRLYYQNEVVQ